MQYFMIMQYGYLERVGRHVRHLGSLKLIFFTGCALDRHVLHHREKFCGDRSYCCGDIAIYRVFFLAKCKNSKDDRAKYGITLPKVEIIEQNFAILIRYERTNGV